MSGFQPCRHKEVMQQQLRQHVTSSLEPTFWSLVVCMITLALNKYDTFTGQLGLRIESFCDRDNLPQFLSFRERIGQLM